MYQPGQDSVSDGADNTWNIPVDVVEDAKQTHPHHEEEISDDDVVISNPDYTPSLEESYEGVIKDHPELKDIKVKHRNTLLQGTHKWSVTACIELLNAKHWILMNKDSLVFLPSDNLWLQIKTVWFLK